MLVNMTPLSLLFILFIAGVYGQSGFGVSYGSPHICALQGSAVTMSCTFSYPYRSYVVRAFWTKIQVREENEEFPDLSVDPEYSQRIQYVLNNQWNFNLRLSHVTKKDEREYYCRFTTEIAANKWIGIPGVRLSVTDLQLESPERVTEGDSVRLTCNSSCKLTDTPTFIWYRNSQRITGNIHHELLVHQVRRGLTDNYSCGVLGSFYISPVVSFDVRYAPDTPVISMSGSAVIKENDSVSLSCSSDSNPPAEISWFKGTTFVGSGRIFNISKISSDDSGEYKCRATNEHGVKYSDGVTINVQYPPRNVSVSINGSAVIVSGDSVGLMCISDSNPPALNFSWFKENQSSAVGSGQSFSAVQSGRFYCEAHNPHGAQRSDAVTVTVRHSWHVWLGITVAFIGLLLIILIIVFIMRNRKAPKAEDVNAKQDDLYSSITESGVRASQSADCADAMYASVSSSKTERDENTEEMQYATVQIHKKKPKKRAEENECHYDNIGIHQPDPAMRQSNVETVEEGSVIYSCVR
ncbi:uncharacterized protein isoform X2 [Danio rerio]|uniref:Uncharacterized protein isoform X2 n=1 Tax=Danio rerio TaxID=7955 RepID=A0AC58G2G4_DANRE